MKALVNTVDIFSKDIGIQFGISKCTNVIVHKGKFEQAEGIPSSTDRSADVESDKGHKYLGVQQINENMLNKIKDETKQTYIKRLIQVQD